MNVKSFALCLVLLAGLCAAGVRAAEGGCCGGGEQPTSASVDSDQGGCGAGGCGAIAVSDDNKAPAKDGEISKEELDKLIAAYPLKTCVVTNQELGGMGKTVDHIYKSRLVRLCCKGCIKAFNKDPEKYLALIDEAAKKKGEN